MKVFIDTETTGLDNKRHQILTLGLHATDGETTHENEWKIKQQLWADIDPKSMEINGIDLEEHNKDALTEIEVLIKFDDAIKEISNKTKRIKMYGQNVGFDIGFIKKMYERKTIFCPIHYHFMDTMILACALKDAGMLDVENVKLETLCKHFGLPKQTHTALDDAKNTAQIYFKMLDMIKIGKINKLSKIKMTKLGDY